MDPGMRQDLIEFTGPQQFQWTSPPQLPARSEKIPHHTPFIAAAKDLQHFLNAGQKSASDGKLPFWITKSMFRIAPKHNAMFLAPAVEGCRVEAEFPFQISPRKGFAFCGLHFGNELFTSLTRREWALFLRNARLEFFHLGQFGPDSLNFFEGAASEILLAELICQLIQRLEFLCGFFEQFSIHKVLCEPDEPNQQSELRQQYQPNQQVRLLETIFRIKTW
jgi:hypothetical protein